MTRNWLMLLLIVDASLVVEAGEHEATVHYRVRVRRQVRVAAPDAESTNLTVATNGSIVVNVEIANSEPDQHAMSVNTVAGATWSNLTESPTAAAQLVSEGAGVATFSLTANGLAGAGGEISQDSVVVTTITSSR